MAVMEAPTHVIDPDGDVMIVLEDANLPFAVWDQEMKAEAESDSEFDFESDTDLECERRRAKAQRASATASTKPPATNADMKRTFRILVSAKHLILASPIFKKALTGGFKESISLLDKGSVEVIVDSWDLEALLMMLNIIHCRYNELPRDVSLELLGKFALIADYYGCSDVMRFFANVWVNYLKIKSPLTRGKHSRDVILWLWVSWAFKMPDTFRTSTSIAMTYSRERITHLGLPIPIKIFDEMNEQRERAIQGVLESLQEQRMELLWEKKSGCAFECDSIMLGSLERQMYSKGILSPKPTSPYPGLEYHGLVNTIRAFKVPKTIKHFLLRAPTCDCDLRGYFRIYPRDDSHAEEDPISIPASAYQVKGLSLDLYKSS